MTDVTFAMEAKSDQLNALDILGQERIIKIRSVDVRKTTEQPISIFFDGDNNRAWKPSKGMIRILAAAWGTDSAAWVGRSAQIYCNPDVIYAGQAVGGIQIRALSHIAKTGLQASLTINRKKREPYLVKFLDTTRPTYPQDRFDKGLPTMIEKMQSGEMTLQTIIAQCQKTGDLTPDQIATLESSAPVEIDHDDDEIM